MHRRVELRSIALHQAVAERINENPEILATARGRVERWLTDGGPPHPVYAKRWQALLGRPIEEITAALVADTEARPAPDQPIRGGPDRRGAPRDHRPYPLVAAHRLRTAVRVAEGLTTVQASACRSQIDSEFPRCLLQSRPRQEISRSNSFSKGLFDRQVVDLVEQLDQAEAPDEILDRERLVTDRPLVLDDQARSVARVESLKPLTVVHATHVSMRRFEERKATSGARPP